MSLDVTLHDPTYTPHELYDANITHNLGEMATKAGIYEALWRPYRLVTGYTQTDDYDAEMDFENSVIIIAEDITELIETGLNDLKARPEYFKKFNSSNGWGTYKHFVPFVEKYLEALKEYPKSIVTTDR